MTTRPVTRHDVRALACLAAALALVAAAAPPAVASHQQVDLPPPETGAGSNRVAHEPNHADDANGFPRNGFSPDAPALVLEAYHESQAGPVDANANALLRTLRGAASPEQVLPPGLVAFNAYWGWWTDTGSGGRLHEANAGGGPDGAIDDGHDDPAAGAPATGPWDEFVWRGKNPWAPAHGHDRHPDDVMLLFLHPGTYTDYERQATGGWLLRNDHDHGHVPDAAYKDNTDTAAYAPHPVPQQGGWSGAGGYATIATDGSLLVTTVATTSVNPKPLGDGRYAPHDATAVDADAYTTPHPLLEGLYRTAVWDPEDREESPLDGATGPRGAKQAAKDTYTALAQNTDDALVDAAESLAAPASRGLGLAHDAAGARPATHEPNHAHDDYNGWATHDPATTYGAGVFEPYYQPGANQSTAGYQGREHLWLDAHARYGAPAYLLIFPLPIGLNLAPAPHTGDLSGQERQHTHAPGFLTVQAHAGTWWDANGDGWVGDLGEAGRLTAPHDPYRGGVVDDPNDYTDHPAQTASDPAKTDAAEWRGLCEDGHLQATLTPRTPGGHWGGAGVYVLHDGDGGYNPYDDAAYDALGTGPWGDDDGAPLSRYVTHGPIDIPLSCYTKRASEGEWLPEAFVLLPTGTLDFAVEVTVDATITGARLSDVTGESLTGETVRDVDHVTPWT